VIAGVSAQIPEGASVLPLLETAPGSGRPVPWPKLPGWSGWPSVDRLPARHGYRRGGRGAPLRSLAPDTGLPRHRHPSPARRRYRRARRPRPASCRRGPRTPPRVRREALHPSEADRGGKPRFRAIGDRDLLGPPSTRSSQSDRAGLVRGRDGRPSRHRAREGILARTSS
jgi:hypothetical protein